MKTKVCKVKDCNNVATAKTLCWTHYLRQRRHGSTDKLKFRREKLIEEGKSYCPKCNEIKPLDEFLKDSYTAFGISIYCKECHRKKGKVRYTLHKSEHQDNRLKKKFGITLQEYTDLFKKQGERCAICKKDNKTNKMFPVDHCHKTNEVRGVLCEECNKALGLFYDNLQVLQNAIEYLKSKIPA